MQFQILPRKHWRNGGLNTQFCSMHDSIKINLRENILKILVFGNSYSYSTLGYLPELMREAAPELSFSMGLLYKSGADLANHIEYFNQDTPYPRYSEYLSSNGHFTNTENLITSKEALDRQDWDVIILQANRPYLEDDPYLQIEQLKNLISEYLDYPIDHMLNQNQTRAAMNDSSLSEIAGDTILEKSNNQFYQKVEWMDILLKKQIVKDILPCGTAVQNFRNNTDTSNIGTEGSGYLCDDAQSHLRNGIGPLVAGYAATIKLLDYAGKKTENYTSSFTPTDSWLEDYNLATKTSHGTCVGLTDENILLGQKCARYAVSDPFRITVFQD